MRIPASPHIPFVTRRQPKFMPVRSAQPIWRQMSHVLALPLPCPVTLDLFPLRHFQAPTRARSSLPSRRTCPPCRSRSGTFSVSPRGSVWNDAQRPQTLKLAVCLQVCTRWWSSCYRSAWSCWCSAGSSALSVRWSASPGCWWDPPPTSSSAVSLVAGVLSLLVNANLCLMWAPWNFCCVVRVENYEEQPDRRGK